MRLRLGSLLPFAGGLLAVLVFVVWIPTLASCGQGTGACVSTDGTPPECKQDWTKDECADWNTQGVNGGSWSFHQGDSCADQGFTYRCPDGSYTYSSGDC